MYRYNMVEKLQKKPHDFNSFNFFIFDFSYI
jgi:hypothetical protein